MKLALLVAQPREITFMVRKLGFETIGCSNCVQAIRMAIKENPDLIIAHADHPIVSGIEMNQFLSLFQLHFAIVLIAKNPTDFNGVKVELPIVSREEALEGLSEQIEKAIEHVANDTPPFLYQLRQREWMDLLSGDPRPRVLIADTSQEILGQGRGLLDQYEEYYIFSASSGLETVIKALLLRPQLILISAYFEDIKGIQISQIFYLFGLVIPVVLLVDRDDQDTKMAAFSSYGVMNIQNNDSILNTHEFLDLIDGHLGMSKDFKDFQRPVTPDELAYQESEREKRELEAAIIESGLTKREDTAMLGGFDIDPELMADLEGLMAAPKENASASMGRRDQVKPEPTQVIKKAASLAGMSATVSQEYHRAQAYRSSKGLAGLFR